MYRQKSRIVCKSRDDGVFRRGQIGGENEVEQGAKNTALGDARLYYLASKFCRLIAVGNKWIPTNRTIVSGHRQHQELQKLVVFPISNELEEEIQLYSWNIMYECMFTYIWNME